MVGTVRAGRRTTVGSAFAAGTALGAILLFGTLGTLGTLLQPGRVFVTAAAVLAGAAVLMDLAGLRVRPQVRLQVPERWRRTMPLSRALFLYGVLLGTGVATLVPAAAAWALLPASVALASVPGALAVGLSFAAGRALPVLALAARGDETALAERPQGLRVLRVLAAGSLVVAAGRGRGASGDSAWPLRPAIPSQPTPISSGRSRASAASCSAMVQRTPASGHGSGHRRPVHRVALGRRGHRRCSDTLLPVWS